VLYREFERRSLAMVSVSLREPAGTVREWGEDFGIDFPLWIDSAGETPTAFGVRGHPSTILLDRAGRIVGRVPGERNWSAPSARALIEWLLAQPER
jgi:hypothetical protein